MNVSRAKIIAGIVLSIALTSTTAYAASTGNLNPANNTNTNTKQYERRFSDINKDQFKNLTLQQKKDLMLKKATERFDVMVKSGKITADEETKKLADLKTKLDAWDGTTPLKMRTGCGDNAAGEKFKNMTLDQKKSFMISKFTEKQTKLVQSGKLTQVQADQNIKDFQTKINAWDGKTPIMGKGHGHGFRNGNGNPNGGTNNKTNGTTNSNTNPQGNNIE